MASLPAGQYRAKILGYNIVATKAGDPSPTIVFQVIDGSGMAHRVFWQGSITTQVGREIALKALHVCGLKNPDDLYLMAGNIESGVLDTSREVFVTIEIQTDPTDPDKSYPRVKWINDITSLGGNQKLLTPEQAKRLLSAVNLKSAWATLGLSGDSSAPADGQGSVKIPF